MRITIHRNELKILAVIVVAAVAFVAWSRVDTTDMMGELEQIGQDKLAEYFDDVNPDDYETLILVDGGKAFKLFGRAWGVVHVYIRDKGDEDMKTFKGIEYFFRRYGDTWQELDSAGCGALEHHVRAFKEFERRGMKVSPDVYARLNQ